MRQRLQVSEHRRPDNCRQAAATTTAAAAANTTTAAGPPRRHTTTAAAATVDFSKLTGSIIGSGATFPKGFYDDAIATLAGIAPS